MGPSSRVTGRLAPQWRRGSEHGAEHEGQQRDGITGLQERFSPLSESWVQGAVGKDSVARAGSVSVPLSGLLLAFISRTGDHVPASPYFLPLLSFGLFIVPAFF